jgi:cytochrome c55X
MARSYLAAALVASAMAVGTAMATADSSPSPERRAELIYQVEQDCGSCHGLTMKGGLGPALLPQSLADKPDDLLAEIIVNGVPGTPMPPWTFEIDRDEALWIVQQLKKGL